MEEGFTFFALMGESAEEMSGIGKKLEERWGVDEVIAFECALARDEREDWEQLKKEDAAFEHENLALLTGNRRKIVLSWLRHRLEKAPEIKLAAESVTHSVKLSGQLLGAGGMLLGLATATAALAYTGEAPINVSAFFSVFVLLQAVFAALLVVAFLLPKAWRERFAFGPLFRLSRWVLDLILSRMQALSARFLSGQQRQDAAEWAGAARRAIALHGSVAKWLAFVKIQAAALFFSFGALAALLVAVAFSDRAFGWQTTLQVEDAAVFEVVEKAALPWAWHWGEGVGYPSVAQIEGSRIVLKEGIQGLETTDLAAWWRFLALGIVVYGMLPRLLFYGLGKWQLGVALARYDFRNASAERLLKRLTPEASRFDAEVVQQGAELSELARHKSSGSDPEVIQGLRYLCSEELGESFDVEALSRAIAKRWALPDTSVVAQVYREGRLVDVLEVSEGEKEIALVFESWMPPIRELERQVKELRQSLEERTLIKVVLLGIPAVGEEISLKPEKQYADAWNSFVRRLGDPYLILENPAL